MSPRLPSSHSPDSRDFELMAGMTLHHFKPGFRGSRRIDFQTFRKALGEVARRWNSMTQEQVDGLLDVWGWGFGVDVFWVGVGMCSISPWRILEMCLGLESWVGLGWIGLGGHGWLHFYETSARKHIFPSPEISGWCAGFGRVAILSFGFACEWFCLTGWQK